MIQDEEGYEIYSSQLFTLESTPGIVAVTLPEILETGKLYRWYFRIRCNENSSPDDFVYGWIERVPELDSNLLEGKTSLEKAIIYAENALWFDAINELEKAKNEEPNNEMIMQVWSDLLTQVGFWELINESVVQFK